MNKVMLVGNLGADPELRYTSNSKAVCTLNLATNRTYVNAAGEKVQDTQWHRVVVWGRQAEICKEYLTKGRQISVEGRLQSRQWQDNSDVKRWVTEVISERVGFLSGPRQEQKSEAQAENHENPASQEEQQEVQHNHVNF